jgi:hypothetical protein
MEFSVVLGTSESFKFLFLSFNCVAFSGLFEIIINSSDFGVSILAALAIRVDLSFESLEAASELGGFSVSYGLL